MMNGMTRMARTFRGLGLAVALAGAAAAWAQPGQGLGPVFQAHHGPMERMLGPEGEGGRWWNNPKVIDRLKLTDEQRKDMDQILLQHRETLIDLHAGVEKAELAMEPLVGADQPNEQAILAQIDKIAQARAELEKANARFLLAIRAKLTPDQFKELQAMRKERVDRGDRNFRFRGRPAPGGRQGGPGAPGSPDSPGTTPPPAGPGGPQSMLPPPPGMPPAPDSFPVPDSGTVD